MSSIVESKEGNSRKGWLNSINYLKEDQERVRMEMDLAASKWQQQISSGNKSGKGN